MIAKNALQQQLDESMATSAQAAQTHLDKELQLMQQLEDLRSSMEHQSRFAAERDPLLRVIIPVVVAVGFLMEQLDSTVITTAIPDMARSLATTPLRMSLAVTTYVLTLEDPHRFRKSRDAGCFVGLQPGRRTVHRRVRAIPLRGLNTHLPSSDYVY